MEIRSPWILIFLVPKSNQSATARYVSQPESTVALDSSRASVTTRGFITAFCLALLRAAPPWVATRSPVDWP